MRMISQRVDGRVDLYDFDRGESPIRSIELTAEVESVSAHPDDLGIAYADRCEVVRLNQDAAVVWRVAIHAEPGSKYGGHVSCGFSHDGSQLWVFSPDAMLNRGDDRILVIDDATGSVVASPQPSRTRRLRCHGASASR
ncbi:hypothetical protein [Rhizocola hellebori]|uniref:hypothetical protein n=1 Tax=Rhizocola hellebori TaxID=1392758 RepID=UPI0019443F0A|nr:hypothetical protein [Rhizocola hellebori]